MIREKKSLDFEKLDKTLNDMLKFPLMEAIAGRRARRFCLGAEIPEGVLAFKSKHPPMPLSEIEKLIVLSTMGGVTGWHFAIMRHAKYAPKLSNYCGSPVGRTFPSSAGFITSELFYTDDSGTYFFPTKRISSSNGNSQWQSQSRRIPVVTSEKNKEIIR